MSSSPAADRPQLYGGDASRRVTLNDLAAAKERGERWPMLTAYDAITARIFDEAGVPVLLVGDSAANVLSTPNVLTLDNEEAKIVVGQNVPFITGTYTPTSGSATNPFQTIERKDVGITLRVTPTVSEAGAVKLKIFQEVSSVTRDKVLVQSADIITNKRTLESTVLIDSGQIVVLGGLIQDDQQAGQDKVPLLGDIPYLGWLFKNRLLSTRKTELLVFITPKIVTDRTTTAAR